jgi:hypothetical protein
LAGWEQVENRLHWRLDVIFNEDASRICKGNAPAIMTAIRQLAINLRSAANKTAYLTKTPQSHLELPRQGHLRAVIYVRSPWSSPV